MAELSKNQGIEMEKSDEAHRKAMEKIQSTMQDPEAMNIWFENKRKEFDVLPEKK